MKMYSIPRWQAVPAARKGHRPHCLLAVVAAAFSLVAVTAPGASGQAGTPTAGLDVVTPAECTVEPRSDDALRALFREIAATPIAIASGASPTPAVAPTGAPASKQTVTELNATWRQYLACLSSGDQTRMFAVLSDDMVRRQFVVDIAFGVDEEALFDYLAATPVPLQPDQFVSFVPFTEARVLGDGRAAVIGPGELGRGDVRIFAKEGGHWVVDDWFALT